MCEGPRNMSNIIDYMIWVSRSFGDFGDCEQSIDNIIQVLLDLKNQGVRIENTNLSYIRLAIKHQAIKSYKEKGQNE